MKIITFLRKMIISFLGIFGFGPRGKKDIPSFLETEEEKRGRIEERRRRIIEKTHVYTLNREDRRFLLKVTGEKYPPDSKTSKDMVRRVRLFKRMKLNLFYKRIVARQFLTTGILPPWAYLSHNRELHPSFKDSIEMYREGLI